MRDERGRLADVAVAVAFAALTAIVFSDVLGSDRGLFFRDHVLVFKPTWWAAIDALGRGRWPTMPMGAAITPVEQGTPAAFFTPLTLLFALGRFEVVYDVFVACHVWLCALGVYTFARWRRLDRPAAAVAALVVALSGPLLSFENLLVGLQGLAWAPWVSWAIGRLVRSPSLGGVALLAMLGGFELQGVMPEVVLIQAFVLAIVLIVDRQRPGRAAILGVLAASVLALSLAAIDLGPLLEQLASSRRGAGFSVQERSGSRFMLGSVIELLVPSFWAPPELAAFNVPRATGTRVDPPYLVSLYCGPALALAGAALATRRRVVLLGFASGVFALVMSMGEATPIYAAVTSLPVLASSRYAVKYVLGVVVALAALAAVAVQSGVAEKRPGRVALLIQTGIVAVIATVCCTDVFRSWLGAHAAPLSIGATFDAFRALDMVALAIERMQSRVWLALLGCCAVMIALAVGARMPRVGAWALVLALGVDMSWAGRRGVLGVDLDARRPAPILAEHLPGARHRVFLALPPPVPIDAERSLFESFEAQRGWYGFGLYEGVRRFEPYDLDGQATAVQLRVFQAAQSRPPAEVIRLMERSGVRYVSGRWGTDVARDVGPIPPAGAEGQRGDGWRLSELARARAYVATSTAVVVVATIDERVAQMAARPPSIAVVDERGRLTGGTSSCAAHARALEAQDWHVRADIEATCAALVILGEYATKQWILTVDDVRTEPVLVDAGLLGAVVPAGAHRVRFEYVPSSSTWWPVSAAGLGLWSTLLVLARQRTRKRQ